MPRTLSKREAGWVTRAPSIHRNCAAIDRDPGQYKTRNLHSAKVGKPPYRDLHMVEERPGSDDSHHVRRVKFHVEHHGTEAFADSKRTPRELHVPIVHGDLELATAHADDCPIVSISQIEIDSQMAIGNLDPKHNCAVHHNAASALRVLNRDSCKPRVSDFDHAAIAVEVQGMARVKT